jgi:uncharacterized protein involved in response to NO
VRNWTGQPTLHGGPLGLLGLAWLLARATSPVGGPWLAVSVAADLVFLTGLGFGIARPVVRVRQWRQVGILSKVALLGASHVLWAVGALGGMADVQRAGLLSGLFVVVALLLTVAQRVLPFFTRRTLGEKEGPAEGPWAGRAVLLLMLGFWALAAFTPWQGAAAVLAVPLVGFLLRRWVGWFRAGVVRHPLLWVLYAGYAWVALGFGLYAAAVALGWPLSPALHAFGTGAIGTMTVGMMVRVSLGHTGRNVRNPPHGLALLFGGITLAAVLRVGAPLLPPGLYGPALAASQVLWIATFAALVAGLGPMLLRPRVDDRTAG